MEIYLVTIREGACLFPEVACRKVYLLYVRCSMVLLYYVFSLSSLNVKFIIIGLFLFLYHFWNFSVYWFDAVNQFGHVKCNQLWIEKAQVIRSQRQKLNA